ncbi:MAG: hypothetical protein L3J54_10955 [Draconibacterium sp.]|nr:hypothetical protein [Draconibacterium sp.]
MVIQKHDNKYFNCSVKTFKYMILDANSINPMIFDSRHEKLTEKIVDSKEEKIVVLFDGRHIKGTKKL